MIGQNPDEIVRMDDGTGGGRCENETNVGKGHNGQEVVERRNCPHLERTQHVKEEKWSSSEDFVQRDGIKIISIIEKKINFLV